MHKSSKKLPCLIFSIVLNNGNDVYVHSGNSIYLSNNINPVIGENSMDIAYPIEDKTARFLQINE